MHVTVMSSHPSCTKNGHDWTTIKTNNQSMYARFILFFFFTQNKSLFLFNNMHTNSEHTFIPCCEKVVLYVYKFQSQLSLNLVFMSWVWHAYYYHYCYYAFRAREVTLDLTEAGGISCAITRLVWFMIYAWSILPEVTPLEEMGGKNLF